MAFLPTVTTTTVPIRRAMRTSILMIVLVVSVVVVPAVQVHAWTLTLSHQQNGHYCRSAAFASGSSSATTSTTCLWATAQANSNSSSSIQSPVLQQLWPELQTFIATHGHPNIPLGCSAGRQCDTLRRLFTQHKLHESDVALLNTVKFTWHSLEDVYATSDFELLYDRLVAYQQLTNGNVSPPKKYAPDPELGAWVTGIRRAAAVQPLDAKHVQALDKIGFEWVSPRVCGSKFMTQLRALKEQKAAAIAADPEDDLWEDAAVRQWVGAQQHAAVTGTLSETRQQYLAQLMGADWKERVLQLIQDADEGQ